MGARKGKSGLLEGMLRPGVGVGPFAVGLGTGAVTDGRGSGTPSHSGGGGEQRGDSDLVDKKSGPGFFRAAFCKMGGFGFSGFGLFRGGGGLALQTGGGILVNEAGLGGTVHGGCVGAESGADFLGFTGFGGGAHLLAEGLETGFGGAIEFGAAFGLAHAFEGRLGIGHGNRFGKGSGKYIGSRAAVNCRFHLS